MRYLNEFFSLRCSGDVLNACAPFHNGAKEVAEAMAMRKLLKGLLLDRPMELAVVDLCSGNALLPLLSVFTLPAREAIAVDRRPRNRDWHEAKRFRYLNLDIYSDEVVALVKEAAPAVVTSIHPCSTLAERVISVYQEADAEALLLMPCCVGPASHRWVDALPSFIPISKYDRWVAYLAGLAGDHSSVKRDDHIPSPANCIISARRQR